MKINGKTKTVGLIGCPVEHTLSPVIHNYLSGAYGQNMVYLPFHVEEAKLEAALAGAYGLGICGLNVTVPHKQNVIGCLKEIDAAAAAIGAVNTLVRVEGGYKGHNTDMEGLRRAVRSEGISLTGRTVVVLGAGGASKAVVYMCLLEGASKVYLLNRTLSKAQEIADAMNTCFRQKIADSVNTWGIVVPMQLTDYAAISESELYVFQATSIGLAPNIDDVALEDAAFYQKIAVGYDLIYNPAETKFMKLVKAAGGRAYNGLKMLLYQGVIAYGCWTGLPLSELEHSCENIYEMLYHEIHGQDNLILIGFMGAGKTTVGRQLAKMLQYDFIDTDAYIEKKTGMAVSDIFAEKGEAYFRKLETDVLSELLVTVKHTVFATGGGMPLREENVRLLRLMGSCVYLCASAEETFRRLHGDTKRPLLRGENPNERISKLLAERKPLYEACSDIYIETDEKTVVAIAEEILWKLELFQFARGLK